MTEESEVREGAFRSVQGLETNEPRHAAVYKVFKPAQP